MSETFKFEAEINQLMNIIINSFYSDKDVFLREIISNSSDALDKIRYESLLNENVLEDDKELIIKITPDKDNKTLTIFDNGIGMSREELISNLGTMARSGTKAFVESLKQNNNTMDLIGQFGVGFYSVFLVGDKVTVISKKNDNHAYVWESNGSDFFSVSEYEFDDIKRGTKIIVHLKEDQLKYLEEDKICKIIEKHSGYIKFPIYLYCEKTKEIAEDNKENADSANDVSANNDPEEVKESDINESKEAFVEDVDESKDAMVENVNKEANSTKETKKTVTYHEYENINKNKPIWTKNVKDITEDEYKEFYKSFSGDWHDYLVKTHFKVEGATEFTGLFFVPKMAPFDIFHKKKSKHVKLFVKRVLITDDCTDLLPDYLKFLRGLIDSDDLPLNVSR